MNYNVPLFDLSYRKLNSLKPKEMAEQVSEKEDMNELDSRSCM